MSDPCETNVIDDLPHGAIVTNRIEIVTYIDPGEPFDDNYIVGVKSNNGNDKEVALITAMGMLEIAKGMVSAEDDDE